jgi:hypothetical protein
VTNRVVPGHIRSTSLMGQILKVTIIIGHNMVSQRCCGNEPSKCWKLELVLLVGSWFLITSWIENSKSNNLPRWSNYHPGKINL